MKKLMLIVTLSASAVTQGCSIPTIKATQQEMAALSTNQICRDVSQMRRGADIVEQKGHMRLGMKNRVVVNKGILELKRRNTFTNKELDLIERGLVQIGMREKALICLAGEPMENNRSVGAWGTHTQHVYGSRRLCGTRACVGGVSAYIYTENGVVTSWQD